LAHHRVRGPSSPSPADAGPLRSPARSGGWSAGQNLSPRPPAFLPPPITFVSRLRRKSLPCSRASSIVKMEMCRQKRTRARESFFSLGPRVRRRRPVPVLFIATRQPPDRPPPLRGSCPQWRHATQVLWNLIRRPFALWNQIAAGGPNPTPPDQSDSTIDTRIYCGIKFVQSPPQNAAPMESYTSVPGPLEGWGEGGEGVLIVGRYCRPLLSGRSRPAHRCRLRPELCALSSMLGSLNVSGATARLHRPALPAATTPSPSCTVSIRSTPGRVTVSILPSGQ